MSDKQSNLTDKEMEDLQSIVTDTLAMYVLWQISIALIEIVC